MGLKTILKKMKNRLVNSEYGKNAERVTGSTRKDVSLKDIRGKVTKKTKKLMGF